MPTYLSPGVYVEEMEAGSRPIEGVGTAIAAFVGFADQGAFNAPTLVTNWTQFTTNFGDYTDYGYLHHAVHGYFLNGGGAAYIVRIGTDGSGGDATPPRAVLESAVKAGSSAYEIEAKDPAGPGDLSVDVTGDPPKEEGGESESFTIKVRRGAEVVETFEGLTSGRGSRHAVTVVNEESQLVQLTETGSLRVAERLPVDGSVSLPSAPTSDGVPSTVGPDDYVGDVADRTGFGGLEAIDDVTMVSVPDLMSAHKAGRITIDQVKAIQLGMIAHCELMGDRMAIIDTPPDLNAQQVKEWRVDSAGYDSKYAAMYWPWIKVADPVTGNMISIPPSGHLAGIWARNDTTRGVHKAPANEVIRGVVDVDLNITRGENDQVNPVGINAIRAFPGRGIRVWGARTLSSDPAWRYVPVRRLFNFLEGSILNGTNWVVFEPNDTDLWGRIKRTINAFLYRQWLEGALFGNTPEEAFYVKCDEETNPPEVIDAGQVVCEIGVAPVKPAEFVVFRLAQLPSGTSSVAE
jgi:Bacteriophage tail sheath protein